MNTEKRLLENENEPSCLGAVSGSFIDDDVISAFKIKYNDIMDLTFKPYDVLIPSFKAFDGENAICSVSYNPIINCYQCWYNEDYLVTKDKNKAMDFLKINDR